MIELVALKKAQPKKKAATQPQSAATAQSAQPSQKKAKQKSKSKAKYPELTYQALAKVAGELCFDPSSTRCYVKTPDGTELRIRSIATQASIHICRKVASGQAKGIFALWPAKQTGYTLAGVFDSAKENHRDSMTLIGKYRGPSEAHFLVGIGRNAGDKKILYSLPIYPKISLPDWAMNERIAIKVEREGSQWVWTGRKTDSDRNCVGGGGSLIARRC